MKNNLYKKMIAVGMSIAFIPFFQLYSSSATDSETTNIQLEYIMGGLIFTEEI